MTGPEHFRLAESLLKAADEGSADWEPADWEPIVATAQVHATLALTAAVIAQGIATGQVGRHEWATAMNEHRPAAGAKP